MISKSTELKIVRSLTIDKEFYFQKYYKFWLRFRASVSLPPPGANDFDLSRNTKRCMMKRTPAWQLLREVYQNFSCFKA